MKIGLCMSVIGAGGGNDTVFLSIEDYLNKQGHTVTRFSNTNPNHKINSFGLFRQLQEINNPNMHNQDLLIFLTGIPPRTKVPIVYYHQQLPFTIFTKEGRPEKYNRGFWRIYYGLFAFIAGLKSARIENNITHYCISEYLQRYLTQYGIDAFVIRPAIIQNDLYIEYDLAMLKMKQNRIVTVCRISPEKNLEFNFRTLRGLNYAVLGSVNRFTGGYARELTKRLEPKHQIKTEFNREHLLRYILDSRVYFSSSKETLGLAVLEGISAGCIPIVPDNTGNKETVPFRELRYMENDSEHARQLVEKALSGGFDALIPDLQHHVNTFVQENYDRLLEVIRNELVR